jgi:hypothetical protein
LILLCVVHPPNGAFAHPVWWSVNDVVQELATAYGGRHGISASEDSIPWVLHCG